MTAAPTPTNEARASGAPAAGRELRTQGRRTLSAILDAGMRVLAERGYHAARVDDIVRVAEMSHGTFYLYFANKEDLFKALATECAAEMEALAADLAPVGPDPEGEAELRRWLTGYVATYRRYGPVIRAWMEEHVDKELVKLGLHAFAGITGSLRARIVEAGTGPHDDPDAAVAILLGTVERLFYYTSSRAVALDDDAVVETLARMLHRGFFGGEVSRPRAATSRRTRTNRRSR